MYDGEERRSISSSKSKFTFFQFLVYEWMSKRIEILRNVILSNIQDGVKWGGHAVCPSLLRDPALLRVIIYPLLNQGPYWISHTTNLFFLWFFLSFLLIKRHFYFLKKKKFYVHKHLLTRNETWFVLLTQDCNSFQKNSIIDEHKTRLLDTYYFMQNPVMKTNLLVSNPAKLHVCARPKPFTLCSNSLCRFSRKGFMNFWNRRYTMLRSFDTNIWD